GVSEVYAQAFVTPGGKRKVLLVNKRDRSIKVEMAGSAGATEEYVDQTTGMQPSATVGVKNHELELGGLAVAVVTLE
ncbi:MAG TPA: glycosyl hydrolase family 39, partial [Terriglobia bacterium]|nr:glycosyl hydrolase family 39 [Terriglobia bacterium]